MLGLDAGAVVLKFDRHPALRRTRPNDNAAFGLKRFDGLPRVPQDVDEDLLELVRIGHDRRQAGSELLHDRDITRAKVVGHDLEYFLDDSVQRHQLAFRRLLTGEAQQAVHDLVATVSTLGDALEVALRLFVGLGALQQLRKTDDRREGVVELVRHAGHELADRREFLALDQLLLRGFHRLHGALQLHA